MNKSGKKLSFWNRYYYGYINSFVDFLVPKNVLKLEISSEIATTDKRINFPNSRFDYIIASDVLGHIYDIDLFLQQAKSTLSEDGRLVITQYSALWEPVLRLASHLGFRKAVIEQNWLSKLDLENFAVLSGFSVVKSGTKMLLPVYIPFISTFFNNFLANIWPLSHLGIFHYTVLRKPEPITYKEKPSLSIVIAARNEEGTIEKIVRDLPELGSFTELVFIEGNSTDNTYAEIQKVAKEYGGKRKIKFAKQTGKGKGDAVRLGFEMAEGDILAIYDADMTVPPDEIEKFYYSITQNKGDFINGSRLVYPMEKESMRVLNFLGNKFFGFAFSWIFGQPIKDTLCGTKVLWKKDYNHIKENRAFFGDFDPFGDFDLLFGAVKLNLKIIDLPVHYKERIYGETNISRWKHGWLLLKMTVFVARKMKFR